MNFEKLIADADAVTSELVKYFGNLTEQQLNTRVTPELWSIAQCIQHIIIVNDSFESVIKHIQLNNYPTAWYSKIKPLVNFWGKKILKAVDPSNERKLKTVAEWQPEMNAMIDDVILRFVAHQQHLKQVITQSQDLIEKGTVIHSPVSKLVVYKLEDAFNIMIAHEQRHLQQAKSLLAFQYAEKLNIPHAAKMLK